MNICIWIYFLLLYIIIIFRSCQRLAQIVQDKTLWRRVDFRATPILLNDLKEYVKFLQPITISLAIRGDLYRENDTELSLCFFNCIKTTCIQLKELIIEEYCINGDEVSLISFTFIGEIKNFFYK